MSCLGEADVEAAINPNTAFAVESEHIGVEAEELPSDLLLFDSGSGTLSGVNLWIFESAGDAEERSDRDHAADRGRREVAGSTAGWS